MDHIQQRDGRWCVVDLVGKHGPVRTVPVPTWIKVAVDARTGQADVSEGGVLRAVNGAGQAQGALAERYFGDSARNLYTLPPLAISLAGITAGDMRDMFNALKSAYGGPTEC
jgi:hypothetical protein